mmetsp:Transcript_58841/g.137852  ORF Transcript_58841/g.137852 Transcript_58841/m.137852 type:complete len:163 (-) Transcript_58841:166-654(-)
MWTCEFLSTICMLEPLSVVALDFLRPLPLGLLPEPSTSAGSSPIMPGTDRTGDAAPDCDIAGGRIGLLPSSGRSLDLLFELFGCMDAIDRERARPSEELRDNFRRLVGGKVIADAGGPGMTENGSHRSAFQSLQDWEPATTSSARRCCGICNAELSSLMIWS